jgi:spermidine synthase/MFS family permease
MSLKPFFLFFLVSGACSLVYEVIWLRLCMAAFGTTAPAQSAVLSMFMAGLALGSWQGGRLARRLAGDFRRSARVYAAAEIGIAISAFVVPAMLTLGRASMLELGREGTWGSLAYYLVSTAWIALSLLPFCFCMGATFPLAMASIQAARPDASERSFGYLYAANVLGATLGTLISAFVLIELLGFRRSLAVTAAANVAVAIGAFALSLRPAALQPEAERPERRRTPASGVSLLPMLFVTGLASMALQVVWIRMLTPYIGTVVYAFATILALYLAATFGGTLWYRARVALPDEGVGALPWSLAATSALLILPAADPRWTQILGAPFGALRAAVAIVPFCCVLGYLTPRLVDLAGRGDPQRTGSAYAMNVIGCIIGPLLAAFVLLPMAGERPSVWLLCLPLAAVGLLVVARGEKPRLRAPTFAAVAFGLIAVLGGLASRDWATIFPSREVRHDYEATVVAAGRDLAKHLRVNGQGITALTPATKLMVHLPLALRPEPPRSALVLCFGMGTSFRSALSWGVEATAVDLVPSVPGLFGFFHADADELMASPRARVVIDDARRFLERSKERWDLIIVDPPPPIHASASSLLYSREFNELARAHLNPGGVFQQWFPGFEGTALAALTRALRDVFPYLQTFRSLDGRGIHLLASERPLLSVSAEAAAARMPESARRDLLEWFPKAPDAAGPLRAAFARQVDADALTRGEPNVPALSDDRPVNEYYLLRRAHGSFVGLR